MKLKFIGTEAEQLWLQRILRAYIARTSALYTHPKSGKYTVYYDLSAPVSGNAEADKHIDNDLLS